VVNGKEIYDPLRALPLLRPLLEMLEDYNNTTSPVSIDMLIVKIIRLSKPVALQILIEKKRQPFGPHVTL
jgi:hypothetical protein